MESKLTKRQAQCLQFMLRHVMAHGYQPSYRDIADHLGMRSHNGVVGHIKALQDKGVIGANRGSRAIDLSVAMSAMRSNT